MEQYLIDTNVISGYLSLSFPVSSIEQLDKIIDSIPNISVITQIELLSWKTNVQLEENIKNFISDSSVLDLSAEVISNCVTIRRKHKIRTPDAIIAATAITYNLVLITNNEKDFANIKELRVKKTSDI